jgi:uncharacterized membrane protein YqgA involved in biofilm formation
VLITGSILNAIGILGGGLLGMRMGRQFSASTQITLRGIMGLLIVVVGLKLTLSGLGGTAFQIFKQLVVVILSLMLGNIAGRLLHVQTALNRLGKYASQRFASARPNDPNRLNDGFIVCTLLFCAGPLGTLGAVQDGLLGNWQPLAVKMVMDGLAAMGFVTTFGWGVVLSALPVLVYQGSITIAVHYLEPYMRQHGLLDSVSATGGLLIFCVALIVMELKKLSLANYLPSLVIAPLITYYWK